MKLSSIIQIIALIKKCKQKTYYFLKDEGITDGEQMSALCWYYSSLDACLNVIEEIVYNEDSFDSEGRMKNKEMMLLLNNCLAQSIDAEKTISSYFSFEIH